MTVVLSSEPDRISGGFSLGPHVLMSKDGLARTGLVTVGSLIEYAYRVAMPPNASVQGFNDDAKAAFPDSGWEIRDRNNAAPGIRRFVEQVTMFLTLVGLTALAVGGVGAGQAVSAFLDRKREEIATLKSLGAEGGLIFLVYFLQVMMIAVAAVVVGVAAGAALPFLVEAFFAADIPAPARYAVYPEPLSARGTLSSSRLPPLSRRARPRRGEIMPCESLSRDAGTRPCARTCCPFRGLVAAAGLRCGSRACAGVCRCSLQPGFLQAQPVCSSYYAPQPGRCRSCCGVCRGRSARASGLRSPTSHARAPRRRRSSSHLASASHCSRP